MKYWVKHVRSFVVFTPTGKPIKVNIHITIGCEVEG